MKQRERTLTGLVFNHRFLSTPSPASGFRLIRRRGASFAALSLYLALGLASTTLSTSLVHADDGASDPTRTEGGSRDCSNATSVSPFAAGDGPLGTPAQPSASCHATNTPATQMSPSEALGKVDRLLAGEALPGGKSTK